MIVPDPDARWLDNGQHCVALPYSGGGWQAGLCLCSFWAWAAGYSWNLCVELSLRKLSIWIIYRGDGTKCNAFTSVHFLILPFPNFTLTSTWRFIMAHNFPWTVILSLLQIAYLLSPFPSTFSISVLSPFCCFFLLFWAIPPSMVCFHCSLRNCFFAWAN